MPLIPIDGQPLIQNKKDCICGSDIPFLADKDDVLYLQMKQTPCGQSEICDTDLNDFTGVNIIPDEEFDNLSTEQIINGSFTGNANGWLFTGSPLWSYNSNKLEKTSNASSDYFRQILQQPTVPNAVYKITYTISNYGGSGQIFPFFTLPVGATTVQGAASSADGTFTVYIKSVRSGDGAGKAHAYFGFEASAAWTGDIDSITVKRIAETWDFGEYDQVNNEPGWTIDDATGAAATIATTRVPLSLFNIIQPNTSYDIEIEFEGTSSGYFALNVGGNLTTVELNPSGTKTYTGFLSGASHTNLFTAPFSFDGKIKRITILTADINCWDYDDSLWSISDGTVCKLSTGTPAIFENTTTLTPATYYQLIIEVQSIQSGSLTCDIAGQVCPAITTSGKHVFYRIVNVADTLKLIATADFVGCITYIRLFKLTKDYKFELRDESGNYVADISEYANYSEDFVTLAFNISRVRDDDDNPIAYGCYRIWSYDFCEIQYEEIITDGGFSQPYTVHWNNHGIEVGAFAISGGQLRIDSPSTTFLMIRNCINNLTGECVNHPALVHGANYKVEFDVVEVADPSNVIGFFIGNLAWNNNAAVPVPVNAGHYTLYINNVDLHPELEEDMYIGLYFNILSLGLNRIDNVSLQRIEPFDATYVSRKINYMESHHCTMLVRASNDKYGFGFSFNGFYLSQRLPIKLLSNNYNQEGSRYAHSTGSLSRTAGMNEKRLLMIIDYSPSEVHDAMSLMILCQKFEINDSGWVEYVTEDKEYTAEWNLKVSDTLAPSRVNITKQGTIKFMNK